MISFLPARGWARHLALLAVAIGWAGGAGGVEPPATFSFSTRILPVLTKAGCNAGACHGAVTGQGGFRLSLLGYDPEHDYEAMNREFGGRGIDPGAPEQSLLLMRHGWGGAQLPEKNHRVAAGGRAAWFQGVRGFAGWHDGCWNRSQQRTPS